ncbi:MAG: uroporphyrinogen decarboxylase family protein [Christensenellales bacterium]|jgi:uroporphyrinogen decarboxylase
MAAMTSHERFKRMYEHREADRIPILDSPWKETIDRWCAEGMPSRDYIAHFDLDKVAHIGVDNSPRYETRTLEQTDEYVIYTTAWGATLKSWKKHGSTPEFLDFTIKDAEKWLDAKSRMTFDKNRIPWDHLKQNYERWRAEGYWISAGLWFGFDITHSWLVGTERFLIAMMEEPEWCAEIYDTCLDLDLALLDCVWDAGYHFDEVTWPNDMGYKKSQFFSLRTYREMDKPRQARAIRWAHEKGAVARLHSCGDINPFVPELIEIGLDGLNPLEVKAGMDPVHLKRAYGDKLLFHGGIDAVLWDKPDRIKAEIERVVPVMMENGGYIFASDHSIPENVSFQDFQGILETVKRVGTYQ